jgi:hypothetical protein
LLAREKLDTPPLHINQLIHESRDAIGVRAVATQYLGAQPDADVTLLLVQKAPLRFHVPVHLAKATHLIVGEAESLPHHGRHALTQALFERLATRR